MNHPRTMDTHEDEELSVSITRDPFVSGGHLVKLAVTTQIPYRNIYLTVAEARALVDLLTTATDEADLLNIEADETADA